MTPDPTVLRERAKRLEWLSNDRFYVAVEELRADAADLRLLADLLDAIGDPDNLRLWVHDMNSIMLRGVARRIAAVLEAHREQ